MALGVELIDAEQLRIAAAGAAALPLEQSSAWEPFMEAAGGRCWGRLRWFDGDTTIAVATFYETDIRGVKFLWARQGPVWLKPVTPSREKELRQALRAFVRLHSPRIAFTRLHAWYRDQDLHDPFQVIGYDRTVIIDGAKGDREAALALLPKAGKRLLRRSLKKMAEVGVTIQEETGLDRQAFEEFYQILVETAERDGFRPHPIEHYWTMLDAIGPEHARLFSARIEGELVGWDLIGVNDRQACAFYGASTQRGRQAQAIAGLDFEVACRLGEEGVLGLDLMGIHSPRTPQLFDVGRYKLQFANTYTDLAGLWDFPVKPLTYKSLQAAFRVKESLRPQQDAE